MSAAALLLAGQGSERAGMSLSTVEACDGCLRVLEEADEVLDQPLSRWMADGPDDALHHTEIAQPALLALGVAQGRHLMAAGPQPVAMAGHSLGQYTALVLAGALAYDDALRLVSVRGRLMARAVPAGRGAMIAVAGLEPAEVAQVCAVGREIGPVGVACVNAPGRIVLAGERAAVEAAEDACWDAGGATTSMPVRVPFHSELLAPMVGEFARQVAATPIADPRIPVVDNVTALPLRDAGSVRRSLVDQVVAPVLFEAGLRTLAELGAERFVGLGPGHAGLKFASLTVPGLPRSTFEEEARSLNRTGGVHAVPVRA